jgi:hypothetical protein
MKIRDVDALVAEVLVDIEKPYPVDVVDRVFVAIENKPKLVSRYHEMVRQLDKVTVDDRIGRHTKRVTGLRLLGLQQAKSSLIKEVTLLS